MNQSYRVSPNTLLQEIDGETLLLQTDTQLFFSLNGTARTLWESFETHDNLDDVCAAMTDAYDVDPEQLRGDVQRFFAQLREARLVEPA